MTYLRQAFQWKAKPILIGTPRAFASKFPLEIQSCLRINTKTTMPLSAQYPLSKPTSEELSTHRIAQLYQYQWIDLCPGGRFLVSS
ncbi:hypothetical protein CPB83DRAFT_846950 [Crepidotus variabilis]|uniref:Uncharacterized protein n=1 Tax=Crepidotus variabilis TaxID=179855 RepID=A0A9P6EP20_9AGAR|nr:hypothetical protein CPB83DRAFT_846950 [Crepidotus variabilis]